MKTTVEPVNHLIKFMDRKNKKFLELTPSRKFPQFYSINTAQLYLILGEPRYIGIFSVCTHRSLAVHENLGISDPFVSVPYLFFDRLCHSAVAIVAV